MHRRKIWLFWLGVILSCSLGLSCGPSSTALVDQAAEPIPEATNPAAELPQPKALPPETVAILESAGGPDQVVNPPKGDVRLVVISDLNSAYGATDYDPEVDKGIALVPFWDPDLVVCSGDMIAGQSPTLTDNEIEAMWAGFDEHVAAPLRAAKLPYGFTLGNHDASSALGVQGSYLFENERNKAAAYWNDPAHDPGITFIDRDDFPFYYTFKHKDIFFLTWDGSSDYIPPEKLAWVETALSSPEAQGAKMRIMLGHLPLYSVAVGRNDPGEVMRDADQLREMLERHKVHTYISGHHHAYYPAHRGKLQLLHTGILGSGPRPLIDSKLPPRKTLTVIDINYDDEDLTTYTTYDMATLTLIEYGELPRFLAGHNGMVMRRDVAWEDLTAEEKGFCEARLGPERCGP